MENKYEIFIKNRIFCANDLLKDKNSFDKIKNKIKFTKNEKESFKKGVSQLSNISSHNTPLQSPTDEKSFEVNYNLFEMKFLF